MNKEQLLDEQASKYNMGSNSLDALPPCETFSINLPLFFQQNVSINTLHIDSQVASESTAS